MKEKEAPKKAAKKAIYALRIISCSKPGIILKINNENNDRIIKKGIIQMKMDTIFLIVLTF